MLSDWEEQQLAEMEGDLLADKALERMLRAPSRHEQRWLVFRRRFYPVGYLLCALTYMVAVGAKSQPMILAGAGLAGSAAWLVIEVRMSGFLGLFARGLRGLG
jgi:hypothetical protein